MWPTYILGVVSGFGLALLAGMTISRYAHSHSYKPVATSNGKLVNSEGDGTCILKRCSCGEIKTEVISGHWTLEEITGPPQPDSPKKDEELKKLRDMAGL